ncbi:MAG TPA: hypothetical protein PK765_03480 [bacterium]|nr:hypothetical protein [bacterium]
MDLEQLSLADSPAVREYFVQTANCIGQAFGELPPENPHMGDTVIRVIQTVGEALES